MRCIAILLCVAHVADAGLLTWFEQKFAGGPHELARAVEEGNAKASLRRAGLGRAHRVSITAMDPRAWLPSQCHTQIVKRFKTVGEITKPMNVLWDGDHAGIGGDGGEWTPCTHMARYGANFAVSFVRHLAFGLKPASVLEFGCGLGTTSDFLSRFTPGGARVVCVEPEVMLAEVFGHPGGAANSRFPLKPVQLAMLSFAPKNRPCADALFTPAMKFDLVASFEVAEHVPAEVHVELVRRLTAATSKYLVFSAARPGQAGTGHIDASSRTGAAWRDLFVGAGLTFLPHLTHALRFTAYTDRAFDFGGNLIAMGAPGVADVPTSQIPRLAMDCNTTFQYYCDGAGRTTMEGVDFPSFRTVLGSSVQPSLSAVEKQRNSDMREKYQDDVTDALWPELSSTIHRLGKDLQCH